MFATAATITSQGVSGVGRVRMMKEAARHGSVAHAETGCEEVGAWEGSRVEAAVR